MSRLSLWFVGIAISFSINSMAQSPVPVDALYLKNLDNFHRGMTRWKLKNFVPLVGLHILKEGDNTFGSGSGNDIVLNTQNAPEVIGTITKKGSELTYTAFGELKPELDGNVVSTITYTFDDDHNSEKVRDKFITWYIQHVGDDYLLRIMDDENPLVRAYQSQEYFPANDKYIFNARYKPYKNEEKIILSNVIDTWQEHKATGDLIFKYNGKKYKLKVIGGYFVMFTDKTNGDTTFPLGRYVRIDTKDPKNIILDFNYSFSPPRSSSTYTTCDLPPVSNYLPFEILAGEKYDQTESEIIRPIHN